MSRSSHSHQLRPKKCRLAVLATMLHLTKHRERPFKRLIRKIDPQRSASKRDNLGKEKKPLLNLAIRKISETTAIFPFRSILPNSKHKAHHQDEVRQLRVRKRLLRQSILMSLKDLLLALLKILSSSLMSTSEKGDQQGSLYMKEKTTTKSSMSSAKSTS